MKKFSFLFLTLFDTYTKKPTHTYIQTKVETETDTDKQNKQNYIILLKLK